MLPSLVERACKKVKIRRVLGDGGYDSVENFEGLDALGIDAGIRVRKGSCGEGGGARGKVVRDYLKDPTGWRERVGYGQRWMVESFFSGFKRLFGRQSLPRSLIGW